MVQQVSKTDPSDVKLCPTCEAVDNSREGNDGAPLWTQMIVPVVGVALALIVAVLHYVNYNYNAMIGWGTAALWAGLLAMERWHSAKIRRLFWSTIDLCGEWAKLHGGKDKPVRLPLHPVVPDDARSPEL